MARKASRFDLLRKMKDNSSEDENATPTKQQNTKDEQKLGSIGKQGSTVVLPGGLIVHDITQPKKRRNKKKPKEIKRAVEESLQCQIQAEPVATDREQNCDALLKDFAEEQKLLQNLPISSSNAAFDYVEDLLFQLKKERANRLQERVEADLHTEALQKIFDILCTTKDFKTPHQELEIRELKVQLKSAQEEIQRLRTLLAKHQK